MRKRYPQLWAALKNAKTIGQVTAGLVRHYELPADRVNQRGIRAGFGVAWGGKLHERSATGLVASPSAGNVNGKPSAAQDGHIRADIHGNAAKAHVKASGRIEAQLHRWPKMREYA